MATKPYFLWAPQAAPAAASDSDTAGFAVGSQETAVVAATAAQTALASPELGAAAVARPRLRRQSSSGSGKQQQAGGGASKKPPQRGLGVAELERLRCGGDPLRELVAAGDAGAGGLPLLRFPHHHHLPAASAFDVAPGPHYCSSLLAQPPAPAPPVCFVHAPAAGGQRAPLLAPEQQYFRDRWGRMGGFTPVGNGAGGDHHQAAQLPPPPLAPEHPSSQSTIWRPAASSSSCLHTGHRCDLCSRTVRAFAERGAPPPPTTCPPSPVVTAGNGNGTVQDHSIYDLAAAMATAGTCQGEVFLARERKRGAAAAEAPAKKEVREIEFFPAAAAASAHHGGGTGESEFAAPFSSAWYGGAGRRAAAPLDLSLKL
ncbi:hypothetical protein ACP70R_034112 [Stipagrostis hirtigluma subsp. patula]